MGTPRQASGLRLGEDTVTPGDGLTQRTQVVGEGAGCGEQAVQAYVDTLFGDHRPAEALCLTSLRQQPLLVCEKGLETVPYGGLVFAIL